MKKVTQSMSIRLYKRAINQNERSNLLRGIVVCGNKGVLWNTLSYLIPHINQTMLVMIVALSGFALSKLFRSMNMNKCLCAPSLSRDSVVNASDVLLPNISESLVGSCPTDNIAYSN